MRLPNVTPTRCLEWFVVANLGFLGLDILIAHDENAFREKVEWAPILFSATAPLLLLPGALRIGRSSVTRAIDLAVGAGSIALGVLGMVFHLSSAFFVDRTIHSLVYSAPFVAPLAYVGVGLLLLLIRLEPADSLAVGEWALFLALGGFVGNFALSLLDHAQNGFFQVAEWVPVFAAAFACSFLGVGLVRRARAVLRVCLVVCGLEAIVGIAGFVLHVTANLRRPSASFVDRFVHGAPAFAPLLFTNLALLAALAIWTIDSAQGRSGAQQRIPTEPGALDRVYSKLSSHRSPLESDEKAPPRV
jgi:hypothetical protein